MCGCGVPVAVIVSEKVAQYITNIIPGKRYLEAFFSAPQGRQNRIPAVEL